MTNKNLIHVVVVLPDGREHFHQMQWPPGIGYNTEEACRDALYKLGIKTSRSSPKKIHCKLFHLTYKDGKPHRQLLRECDVVPSLERMTPEEYRKEMDEILVDIPAEFHGAIESISYDKGHSSGYEEVISYAREYTHQLKEPIKAFEKRIQGEPK